MPEITMSDVTPLQAIGTHGPSQVADQPQPDFELIELFFFAYRDFVGEPDRVLERFGFGRAHHRVLHFINRHPGLTIAALLDILKITKQSLARVLKDLIENGHVEQRAGTEDRRQRCLFLTPAGAALAFELAQQQGRRIAAALADAGAGERQVIRAFLMGLIDQTVRRSVAELTGH